MDGRSLTVICTLLQVNPGFYDYVTKRKLGIDAKRAFDAVEEKLGRPPDDDDVAALLVELGYPERLAELQSAVIKGLNNTATEAVSTVLGVLNRTKRKFQREDRDKLIDQATEYCGEDIRVIEVGYQITYMFFKLWWSRNGYLQRMPSETPHPKLQNQPAEQLLQKQQLLLTHKNSGAGTGPDEGDDVDVDCDNDNDDDDVPDGDDDDDDPEWFRTDHPDDGDHLDFEMDDDEHDVNDVGILFDYTTHDDIIDEEKVKHTSNLLIDQFYDKVS